MTKKPAPSPAVPRIEIVVCPVCPLFIYADPYVCVKKNLLHPWNMSAGQFRPASKARLDHQSKSLPLTASPATTARCGATRNCCTQTCRGIYA